MCLLSTIFLKLFLQLLFYLRFAHNTRRGLILFITIDYKLEILEEAQLYVRTCLFSVSLKLKQFFHIYNKSHASLSCFNE